MCSERQMYIYDFYLVPSLDLLLLLLLLMLLLFYLLYLLWTSPISHFSTSHLPLDRDRGVHPRQDQEMKLPLQGVERDESGKAEHFHGNENTDKLDD